MNKLFPLWFLSYVGVLVSFYFNYETGFLQETWKVDATKFTYLVTGIYMIAYAWLGVKLYKNSVRKPDDLNNFYEISNWLTGIGLLGTIIGLILMSQGFTNIDLADPGSVKSSFKTIVLGMSTAFYTTAAGMGCWIGLRVPLTLVESRLEKSE